MNKQSIKRILKYTDEESIPLAILGVIEGIIEGYHDGQYATTFEVCEEVSHAIEAWKELHEAQEQECADRTREAFEVFDRLLLRREPQLSDE